MNGKVFNFKYTILRYENTSWSITFSYTKIYNQSHNLGNFDEKFEYTKNIIILRMMKTTGTFVMPFLHGTSFRGISNFRPILMNSIILSF